MNNVSIFGTLKCIFERQPFAVEIEPDEKVQRGDRVLGVLEVESARRLYSALNLFHKSAYQCRAEHQAEHERGRVHSQEDCLACYNRVQRLNHGKDVFMRLFMEILTAEFPGRWAQCAVKEGWKVVAVGENLTEYNFPDPNHPSRTFVRDLERAMVARDASRLSCDHLSTDPVSLKDEEVRLGQIESAPVRAVALFGKNLVNVAAQYTGSLKALLPNEQKDVRAEVLWRSSRLLSQAKLVYDLFWEGARETVPIPDKHKRLGVRKDWTVVRIPQEEGGGQVDTLATAINELMRLLKGQQE